MVSAQKWEAAYVAFHFSRRASTRSQCAPQIPGFGSQKDVPVLRVDHISIKGLLLGVRLTAVSVTPILVEK